MPKKCDLNHQTFVETSLDVLRSLGARVTKTRSAVLQALSSTKKPLSARELFELVSKSKDAGKIDQVTVYRILETLEEFGLIHRVFPSGGYLPCFHQNCGDSLHILIRCSSCEDITELDVPQETLAPMLWHLKEKHGFLPNAHFFQINGLCSPCNNN